MLKGLRKTIYNVGLILVIVSTGAMYAINVIVSKLDNGWYLQNQNLGFLFSLFVLLYLIAYTSMVLLAGFKYNHDEKKRLCTETNFKLVVLSMLLFYPLSD